MAAILGAEERTELTENGQETLSYESGATKTTQHDAQYDS